MPLERPRWIGDRRDGDGARFGLEACQQVEHPRRSQRDVLLTQRLDVQRDAVEGTPLSASRTTASPAPAGRRGLSVVAREVPRDDLDPLRVKRVDEPAEPGRLDDVDGRAIVRGLDPGRAHAAGSKTPGDDVRRCVELRVVDVDPRAEAAEDLDGTATIGSCLTLW